MCRMKQVDMASEVCAGHQSEGVWMLVHACVSV